MASTQELSLEEYRRYGRQMILDNFGLPAQLKLRTSSVIVIGAGGLGCPALQYLVAAGVGTIGIVDHDTVEISNLQRQILHSEEKAGLNKALSAAEALTSINSNIKLITYPHAITPENSASLLEPFDIVLDCTDNPATRYLLSDTCVVLKKPLVSGAAQRFEGQLCTYNYGDGPCYRCLFPKPPRPEFAGSCTELGILGTVTGVIGNLQALEAIKIITGLHEGKPTLLLYSALSTNPFKSVKLRTRRPTCPACGVEGQKFGTIAATDYVAFCGGPRPDWETLGLYEGSNRIKAEDLAAVLRSRPETPLIDVRPPVEFGVCHLPGSINIPLAELMANPQSYFDRNTTEVYFVCRLGNDSQLAANAVRSVTSGTIVQDLIGGLRAWTRDVDPEFPVY
ncbi:hypothetical protein BDY19DRAFT_898999 [Irpex rosettiformis]|uniref:Uncharacterized protein n=1 Tax=Irpex rosettiformis TaxID=378272 RepID=A0ACB8TPY2_9APHY|nr:hypothetical protein BDY19DRAFT_898999 [Irpex rosettiformis]